MKKYPQNSFTLPKAVMGFTLIELVMVMMMMTFMGLMTVPKFTQHHKAQQKEAMIRKIAAEIEYMRNLAFTEQRWHRLNGNVANGISYLVFHSRDNESSSWGGFRQVTIGSEQILGLIDDSDLGGIPGSRYLRVDPNGQLDHGQFGQVVELIFTDEPLKDAKIIVNAMGMTYVDI